MDAVLLSARALIVIPGPNLASIVTRGATTRRGAGIIAAVGVSVVLLKAP